MTSDELDAALAALRAGGVVAVATETWFGLLADARRPSAIDRVLALKERKAEKGIALLLPNADAWGALVVEIPAPARTLAERFWPGPLTITLPARPGIDPRLIVDGALGARWGAPSDAARLVEAFGAPLTATSANLAGRPPLATSAEVALEFADALRRGELLVVGGTSPGGPPSTVVRVSNDRARILRPGPIDRAAIAGALGPAIPIDP
jgi:L-threonylcarbamoyladenylate synthase